jgi:hypothetical protein
MIVYAFNGSWSIRGWEVRKKAILFALLVLVFGSLAGMNLEISLQKIIGDERDDYTFFKIKTAVMDEEENVFVGDEGGYFISKFDKEGRFIKRFGRSGQGPKEFLAIASARIHEKHLYVSDIKNVRITKIDLSLTEMSSFRPGYIQLRGDFYPVSKERYLCTFSSMKDVSGKGRVAVFDHKGEIIRSFFSKNQWGEYKTEKDELGWAMGQITAKVLAGYSEKWKEVFLGFEYPLTPCAYFVYDLEGKELRSFSIEQEGGVLFPEHLRQYPFEARKIHAFIENKRIICYKDYVVLVFNVMETQLRANSVIKKTVLMVVDRHGKVVQKTDLAVGQLVFDIQKGGFMVSTNSLEETPRIYVHKLSI